jgi:hypothetical protein
VQVWRAGFAEVGVVWRSGTGAIVAGLAEYQRRGKPHGRRSGTLQCSAPVVAVRRQLDDEL